MLVFCLCLFSGIAFRTHFSRGWADSQQCPSWNLMGNGERSARHYKVGVTSILCVICFSKCACVRERLEIERVGLRILLTFFLCSACRCRGVVRVVVLVVVVVHPSRRRPCRRRRRCRCRRRSLPSLAWRAAAISGIHLGQPSQAAISGSHLGQASRAAISGSHLGEPSRAAIS